MAASGADARDPLLYAQFADGYASFATRNHRAAASMDQTPVKILHVLGYNEYQTQLNEFLNFKQHIGLASMPQEDAKKGLGQ